MKVFLLAVLSLCIPAIAQSSLQPINFPVSRAFDSNGMRLSGGFLWSYAEGTTTPFATYTDAASGLPNQDPVTLDSTGSAKIFLSAAFNKFAMQNQFGVQQSTVDNIAGSAIASIVPNSTGSQTINQPSGTTLNVNNLNSAAYINGDRSSDNSAAIQTAVNACTGTCNIVLVNVVIGAKIVLPLNVDITFTAIGPVRVTSTSPAFYRYQATSAAHPIANRITFEGISFTKTNAGIIIWDNLFFNSSTNMGITVHNCHFQLANSGSVAIALSGDSGVVITDNVFDTGTGMVGTAIETLTDVIAGDGTVRTPMIVSVANNTFRGGVAFRQVALNTGADPAEGIMFTGNSFILSTVTISGNEINFIGNSFSGANVVMKDLSNSVFSSNYLDNGNVSGKTLLTIDNVVHQQITANSFVGAGQINTTGVLFTNPRRMATGTTNVTLSGNFYTGANNGTTGCPSACVYAPTGGFGIVFGDAVARNIYVGGESFRLLSDAIKFTAALNRSTIESFEARDVFYYAHDISTFAGNFLIADHLYKRFDVHLEGNVWTAGIQADIASQMIYYSMFPGASVSVTQTAPDVCTAGASVSKGVTPLLGGQYLRLHVDGVLSPVGRAFCDVTVIVNGSVYVGPR